MNPIQGDSGSRYIDFYIHAFDNAIAAQEKSVKEAQDALDKDVTNPAAMNKYNAELTILNLLNQASSTTVKTIRDMLSQVIANFR